MAFKTIDRFGRIQTTFLDNGPKVVGSRRSGMGCGPSGCGMGDDSTNTTFGAPSTLPSAGTSVAAIMPSQNGTAPSSPGGTSVGGTTPAVVAAVGQAVTNHRKHVRGGGSSAIDEAAMSTLASGALSGTRAAKYALEIFQRDNPGFFQRGGGQRMGGGNGGGGGQVTRMPGQGGRRWQGGQQVVRMPGQSSLNSGPADPSAATVVTPAVSTTPATAPATTDSSSSSSGMGGYNAPAPGAVSAATWRGMGDASSAASTAQQYYASANQAGIVVGPSDCQSYMSANTDEAAGDIQTACSQTYSTAGFNQAAYTAGQTSGGGYNTSPLMSIPTSTSSGPTAQQIASGVQLGALGAQTGLQLYSALTGKKPATPVYVAPQPATGLSTGAIVGIGVAGLGLLALVLVMSGGKKRSSSSTTTTSTSTAAPATPTVIRANAHRRIRNASRRSARSPRVGRRYFTTTRVA